MREPELLPVGVKQLSPSQLFVGVKLVELLYHLHPRRLWRILAAPDPRLRRQLRYSLGHTAGVFWYEIYEHLADHLHTRHARPRKCSPEAYTPEKEVHRSALDQAWGVISRIASGRVRRDA